METYGKKKCVLEFNSSLELKVKRKLNVLFFFLSLTYPQEDLWFLYFCTKMTFFEHAYISPDTTMTGITTLACDVKGKIISHVSEFVLSCQS